LHLYKLKIIVYLHPTKIKPVQEAAQQKILIRGNNEKNISAIQKKTQK